MLTRQRANRFLAALCMLLVGTGVRAQSEPAVTGSFSTTATTVDIVGVERADLFVDALPVDEPVEWEVFVPDDYTSDRPAGLFVFVSPSNSGDVPRGWKPILARYNLIWVAANSSGNRVAVPRRLAFAVLGAGLIGNRYALDQDRIFVGGFSGGARVSGLLAAQFPELFRGGLYIGGAERWDADTADENIERMRDNRYVFLVGREDFNLAMARRVRDAYTEAGIDSTQSIVVPRMGHALPSARRLDVALSFLLNDAR